MEQFNRKQMKILILCTGNSCRSQMAEGFLKSFDKTFEVFSAGTHPEKEINPANELLEENHEARLDYGKAKEAVRVNQDLETMGEIHRAEE